MFVDCGDYDVGFVCMCGEVVCFVVVNCYGCVGVE